MTNKQKITLLEHAIEHISYQPSQNWIGKLAKSIKIQRIKKKIRSLKKEDIRNQQKQSNNEQEF